jgi:hypothetical protein
MSANIIGLGRISRPRHAHWQFRERFFGKSAGPLHFYLKEIPRICQNEILNVFWKIRQRERRGRKIRASPKILDLSNTIDEVGGRTRHGMLGPQRLWTKSEESANSARSESLVCPIQKASLWRAK